VAGRARSFAELTPTVRILVVAAGWFPDRGGGYARVVTETACRLVARGHDVTALVPSGSSAGPSTVERGVRVHRTLDRGPLPATIVQPIDAARQARRIAAAAPYDVVLAHAPAAAAGIAVSALDKPLVLVHHASPAREMRFDRRFVPPGRIRIAGYLLAAAAALLEHRAVARAQRILVLSEYSRSLLMADHPTARGKVHRVAGGVDPVHFSPADGRAAARRRLGLDPDGVLLVTARRLHPRMGIDRLLAALPALAGGRVLRLAVIGDGPLRRRLQERAVSLGVDSIVRFPGHVSEADLRDWYRAADLFVLPTIAYEGFGMATLEALACGTPVVGTPVGATPELLVPLEPALVAGGAGAESLASAIAAALDRPDSELLSRRCAEYARDRFSWDHVITQWEAQLEEALVAQPPPPAPAPATTLRIGLVAPLPPQLGGVATFAGWLLDQQQRIGCRFRTFDLHRPPNAEAGGRLRAVSVPRQAALLIRFVAWLPRAPRLVHYCVATSRPGLMRDLMYLALLRAAGHTTIAHVHGDDLPGADGSAFAAAAFRFVGRLTTARVALCPRAVGGLAELGVSARAIANPISLEVPAPPERRGPPLRLLFVGSYGERKGSFGLIEGVAGARRTGVDVELELVGKEEFAGEERRLHTLVAARGLADVVLFAGVRRADELVDSYRHADVFCLPSRRDALPMALLEAMASSLPVIATRVGCMSDVVEDGVSGILVDAGDSAAIERAIAFLALEEGARRSMGAAARRRALDVAAPETVSGAWRDLYSALSDHIR
jgi:glycosyltransferase involved in cell wall biosynthesis